MDQATARAAPSGTTTGGVRSIVRRRFRRLGTVALLAVLAVVGIVLAAPAGAPATPSPAQAGSAGTLDFSYKAAGVSAPTGRKTEASKLWFSDGSWWGVLFRVSRDAFTINRYDAARAEWVDTGVVIDDRNDSQADVLRSGDHLYALSGGSDPRSDKDAIILDRLSYDGGSGTYRMDRGFPVQLDKTGSEVFTIARDETGRLWMTLTRDRRVLIAHSLADDRSWTEPEVLPVPEASTIADDDISSFVAYDGHVGVMWSNQRAGAMYWASRPSGPGDGPWSVTAAVQGPALADDHVNLKALHDDPAGLVIATVKTSRNDLPSADPNDPLILVIVLQRDGTWTRHVAGTVSENETRPILEVDQDHRQLYLVASAPCCSGGTIYYKATSLDKIDFPSGRGTVLMRRTGGATALNNPSATKQAINGTSGLLVLAADDEAQVYMHAALPLDGPPVPKPSNAEVLPGGLPASGADPGAASKPLLDDGFENGGTGAWTKVEFGDQSTVSVEREAARTDRLGLRITAGQAPGSFAMARFSFPTTRSSLRVDLDFHVLSEGGSGGNTPLLRLLNADGSRLISIYRQNVAGGRIWITDGTTRSSTLGRVELETWAHLELSTARVGDVVQVNVALDGQLIGGATLAPAIAGMSMIQLGNETKGQSFAIAIDNVRVYR
jgi:hypothetical protein